MRDSVLQPSEITVVIPAYNSGGFLLRTLETVAAQTCLPAEVIVVDDGSADDTIAVAENFGRENPQLPVRVLQRQHVGPGAARNAGIQAARTSWIAFLDADDLWEPVKTAVCVEAAAAHPSANLVCHDEWCLKLDGTKVRIGGSRYFDETQSFSRQLFVRNLLSPSAVICRRDLLTGCGGFDETLSSAQDYELWLRMSPIAKPLFVPEALGLYVDRVGNITNTKFWRRLMNTIRVRHRHRNLVSPVAHVVLMLRAIAGQFAGLVRNRVSQPRESA